MAAEVDIERPLASLRPLRDVVESTLAAADWLDPVLDGAAIELARYYAAHVDAAVATRDPYLLQKAMGVAGPNLHRALVSLGLTPGARGSITGAEKAEVRVDPFDELRKRRAKAAAAAKEA